MCFSKELSIFTTFLVYSAVIYSILNNYHKNKYFLFVILYHVFTSGIIQPLEGFIHSIYEKDKSNKSSLFINTEKLIWFSVLLQPLFAMIFFIILKINPSNNKYVIGLNLIFYIYTYFVYNDVRLKIKSKNENGYTKIIWTNIVEKNPIWTGLEIFTFWSPIIFSLTKSLHMKILLTHQVLILLLSNIISFDGSHSSGSLWCFFSSMGVWIQIIAKKLLEI